MSPELNIKVNLLLSNKSQPKLFDFGMFKGGGNIGSIAILNAFSIMFGMILANKGLDNYKQGLLFTSINHVSNSSSIIKSKPNTSNVNSLFLESSTIFVAITASLASLIIFGYTVL